MLHGKPEHEDASDAMHRRRITLKDGRYMIFYTFGDEAEAPAAAPTAAEKEAIETQPLHEAADES